MAGDLGLGVATKFASAFLPRRGNSALRASVKKFSALFRRPYGAFSLGRSGSSEAAGKIGLYWSQIRAGFKVFLIAQELELSDYNFQCVEEVVVVGLGEQEEFLD